MEVFLNTTLASGMVCFLKNKPKHLCGFSLHKRKLEKEPVIIEEALMIRFCIG